MQATLKPLEQGQQLYSSTGCPTRNTATASSAACASSWLLLETTTETFAAHTVCHLAFDTEQFSSGVANDHDPADAISGMAEADGSSAVRGCHQENLASNECSSAVGDSSECNQRCGFTGGAALWNVLAQGLRCVRQQQTSSSSSSGLPGSHWHCVGVYGALLVLGPGGSHWQLLLGCY